MTATWTAPRTWATDELVTAALMNEQLRDNVDFLRNPPFASYLLNNSDYTTTSSSFVNVDNTNLSLTITTQGGPLLIGFYGSIYHSSASGRVFFDVDIDGTSRVGGDDGLVVSTVSSTVSAVSFLVWKAGLSAASHTFKLQWKTSTSTATLYAGQGTSGWKTHSQFWVKELS